jgi:hypothetical protein
MVGTFYVSYGGTGDITATISNDGETITVSNVPSFTQTSGDSSAIRTRGFNFLIRINTTEGAPLAVGVLVQTANVFMWKINDTAYNSHYSIFPDCDYHEYTFEYVSNYPTLKFVETSWLSVDDSEPGEVTVKIDANDTTSYRNHGITVYTGTSSADSAVGLLVVRQSKAKINLKVNGDSGSTNIDSGDTYFTITTSPSSDDIYYGIYVDDTPWITSISGPKSYTYPCGRNTGSTERTMVVRIITGNTAVTYEAVTVRQASGAKKLNLKINGSTAPSNISSATTGITITTEPNDSTLSYRVYSASHLYITNKTGNYSTIANIGANTATTERSITITAKSMDDTVTETVTIKQSGGTPPYELTVRGYNDDSVNSFDGVNDTPYVVQEYRMNCNTSIGNFGTLREIDIDEYGNNSFGLPRESVSNIYDDTSVDVTLTINPKSSSGNHPAYCTLQWSLDDYSDYKVAYDSNLNQYRFDSSISYPAGIISRIFYIKKIIFSNN